MTRYFLHLKIGDECFPDVVGQELSDLSTAHYRAVLLATKLISRFPEHEALAKRWIVDIEDDRGQRLLEIILNPQRLIAKQLLALS